MSAQRLAVGRLPAQRSPLWVIRWSAVRCRVRLGSNAEDGRDLNGSVSVAIHDAIVITAYKPKLHNIEELGRRVLNLHPGFAGVFPRDTKEDDKLFQQVKNAYIDARGSSTYEITVFVSVSLLRMRICSEGLDRPSTA